MKRFIKLKEMHSKDSNRWIQGDDISGWTSLNSRRLMITYYPIPIYWSNLISPVVWINISLLKPLLLLTQL